MPRPKPEPVYRYHGAERPTVALFPGVPARDLFAEDVARLTPATLRLITSGTKPLYSATTSKAAKEADTADKSAAKAAKE